jgi:prepilin signal peptidase PulO-like enzyme (type II secretory pathway)
MFDRKMVGGADIKILVGLSPALVAMGYFGALYLLWFFVINPLSNNMFSRNKKESTLTRTKKIRFIPYMTIAFMIVVALRFS